MFRKNKSCHENRTAPWHIVTSLLFKPLRQRLIIATSFRLSKSLYSPSVLFFQVVWIEEFTRPNSRHTSDYFFPHFLFL